MAVLQAVVGNSTAPIVPATPTDAQIQKTANNDTIDTSSIQTPSPIHLLENSSVVNTEKILPSTATDILTNQDLFDIKKQFEGLWSENKRLNIALENISNGVKNITLSITDFQKLVDTQNKKIEQTYETIEMKFDNKLKCFMEAYESNIEKKIQNAISSVQKTTDKEIQLTKTEIIKLQLSSTITNKTQQEMRQLSDNQCVNQTAITAIKENIKNTKLEVENYGKDIRDLQNYVKSVKDSHDKPICDLMQNLASINGTIQSHAGQINALNLAIGKLWSQEKSYASAVSSSNFVPPMIPVSNNAPITQNQVLIPVHESHFSLPQNTDSMNQTHESHSSLPQNTDSMNQINTNKISPNTNIMPQFTNNFRNSAVQNQSQLHRSTNQANSNRNSTKNKTELLVCWDSNRKVVDQKRLWKHENTQYEITPTLNDVFHIISNNHFPSLSCVLIHCGTNDLEDSNESGTTIMKKLTTLVNIINSKYPDTKVLISELLPRKDDLDNAVMEVNDNLFNKYSNSRNSPNVYVVEHRHFRSLSKTELLRDNKHLRPELGKRFAGSLRKGLRWAFRVNNATSEAEVRGRTGQRTVGTTDQAAGIFSFCNDLKLLIDNFLQKS